MKTKSHLFLPDGSPKYVRIYDNDGESLDRYTCVFTGRYRGHGSNRMWFQYIAMNGDPFNPQMGICQHGENQTQIDTNRSGFAPAVGKKCHLGKRIAFKTLPEDCQKIVMRDYCELWDTQTPSCVQGHTGQ